MTLTTKRTAERTDFLASILVTAVEGGIGYWAATQSYAWQQTEDRQFTEASVEVRAFETGDDPADWQAVTLDTIAKGIVVLKRKAVPSKFFADLALAVRENDAGYIDADMADAIVQAGLFGTVVYG